MCGKKACLGRSLGLLPLVPLKTAVRFLLYRLPLAALSLESEYPFAFSAQHKTWPHMDKGKEVDWTKEWTEWIYVFPISWPKKALFHYEAEPELSRTWACFLWFRFCFRSTQPYFRQCSWKLYFGPDLEVALKFNWLNWLNISLDKMGEQYKCSHSNKM